MSKILNKKVILTAVVVLVLAIVGFSSLTIVEAGHTGVVVTLGRVEERVLQEGLHLKLPFIQEVVQIDNRITKREISNEGVSKDIQTVETTLAIN